MEQLEDVNVHQLLYQFRCEGALCFKSSLWTEADKLNVANIKKSPEYYKQKLAAHVLQPLSAVCETFLTFQLHSTVSQLTSREGARRLLSAAGVHGTERRV